MEEILNKYNFLYQAEQFLLFLIAFFLPLYKPFTPFLIAIWGLLAIYISIISRKNKNKYSYSSTKIAIAFFILPFYFVLHLIGLLYTNTENLQFGWFDIEVKLSMLIFPLILYFTQKRYLNQKFYSFFFTSFLLGCFTTIIINIVWSFIEFNSGKGIEVFYYISVSRFFHPSYISLYLCFALFVLLQRIAKYAENGAKLKMWFGIISSLILLFYVFLLSSKAGILGSLIVLVAFFSIYLWKKYSPFVTIGVLSLILIIFLSSIFLVPNVRMRFENMALAVFNPPNNTEKVTDGTTSRLNVWESSLNLAIHNLPFGVGTGDVKIELIKEYRANGMDYSADRQLNAHCQYLQSFVAVGIFGLLSLIAVFIIPLWFFKRRIDILYFVLILLFGFNILFESMFEVQAGVVFFSFFYPILLLKTIFRK